MRKLIRDIARPLYIAGLSAVVSIGVLAAVPRPAPASSYAISFDGYVTHCSTDPGNDCDTPQT